MAVTNLPNSGNKFTGSRLVIPGVGLSTYKVQKMDKPVIKSITPSSGSTTNS
jgi:hypothetical protein